MAQIFRGRVRDTTTTTGTGLKTVSGSALSTYRSFSAVMAVNDIIYAAIVNQTANEWEVGLYQYSSTNTLALITCLDSSNAGAAVNFSAGTKDVFAIAPIQQTTFGVQPPGGRLSYIAGAPVLTTTATGQTTVYYVPYINQSVPIYDGTIYHMVDMGAAGCSQTLSDTTKSPSATVANGVYDMFVWVDGGTVRCTRGPVWTNTNTRNVGLTRTGAYLLNSVAIVNGPAALRGTYVGSFFTNASNTADWKFGSGTTGGAQQAIHSLWNMYNRVDVKSFVFDGTGNWTTSVNTWHAANNQVGNSIVFIIGWNEDPVTARYTCMGSNSTSGLSFCTNGIGLDTATATVGCTSGNALAATSGYYSFTMQTAEYTGYPSVGYHTLYAMEISPQGLAVTFYSSGGGGVPFGLFFDFRM